MASAIPTNSEISSKKPLRAPKIPIKKIKNKRRISTIMYYDNFDFNNVWAMPPST